jgi:hypothetical protein
LAAAILAVYSQVAHFDFINYDDEVYVYENPQVRAGLTAAGIKWAFTAVVAGNWAPVTMLSHMLDCELFGMSAGMHHLTNVLFHLAASLLLFASLRRATGMRWPSAFVAFLFALHPLHVESVAWVAERKDVLSAFFCFLSLYAYVRYAEAPDVRRYLLFAAPFAIGLMAKSMLVTFPFALVLFDIWPLRRAEFPRVLWEKIPLLCLSIGASVVTYLVQGTSGAFSVLAPGLRIENALVSYVTYIGNLFWPSRLAMFYMFPDTLPIWQPACALLVLLGISAAAIYTWRTRPYIFSGWFWYLGTLVPVIGLVQVGAQSHADRYTYIPMVGLSWILAWGAVDVVAAWPQTKTMVVGAIGVFCTACMTLAWVQTSYWQDGVTLFQHAVDVTENNFWVKRNLSEAHYVLANNLMNSGHGSEAIAHFDEALRIRPNYPEAQNNEGIIYARMPGGSTAAITHFQAAVQLDPKLAQAHRNLGMLLAAVPGRTQEALEHLEAAQRIQPDESTAQLIGRLRANFKK